MTEEKESIGCEFGRQTRLEVDIMKKKVESIESKAWTLILLMITNLIGTIMMLLSRVI